MFSAVGRISDIDRPVTVQWRDDGTLGGDREAVGLMRAYARRLDGQAVGPVEGPYTYRDHLRDALSTLTLIVGLFEQIDELIGEVPVRVAPPIGEDG